ncbi:MAG TPA: ABC transporter substrate-binding protein [Candidatus Saccharimonadales bacterium]|nr:ABC transporter substrate-binding protein [Candidatus Saccharimonadales bacterium]
MTTTRVSTIKRKLAYVTVGLVIIVGAVAVYGFRAKLFAPKTIASLRVGYLPVTGHAKFFIAQEEGFFKDEGLNVQLTEFANSADGLAALRADKLDLGAFGTTAPLVHIAKGADISIIGGVMGEDAAIVVKPENENVIKNISNLKGKKVATIRLATGDAVLRGALSDAGLNWKTDLQIFELKTPPAVLEAVKSGQVDAGVIWGPHDLRAEEQGLKVVIRSGSLQPGHPCCRLTVHTQDAQQRREVWAHFVRAILRAEKFANDNHQKTVDDIAKYLKLDHGLIEHAYYSGHLDQATDPNLAGVQRFWETMNKSGFVESKDSIAPHVQTAIYKQALDELAKENPNDPFWQQREQVFAQRDR